MPPPVDTRLEDMLAHLLSLHTPPLALPLPTPVPPTRAKRGSISTVNGGKAPSKRSKPARRTSLANNHRGSANNGAHAEGPNNAEARGRVAKPKEPVVTVTRQPSLGEKGGKVARGQRAKFCI